MLDEGEAVKKLKNETWFSHLLSKSVANDYTAVLFIYTFCFAEYNLINLTVNWFQLIAKVVNILNFQMLHTGMSQTALDIHAF